VYESIVTDNVREAERIDREENERYGQAPGDEVPEQLRTRKRRLAVSGLRKAPAASARCHRSEI
jgi:hypothetical protein